MRTLTYIALPQDEGRLIRRIVRGGIGLSHRQFSRAKYANCILLDGVPAHADQAVRAGQTVSVLLEDAGSGSAPAEEEPVSVVYEDEDLLVIDKDAPLPCQNSSRQSGSTLEKRLSARYGEAFVFRPVNRLDKGTSGLMLAAKNAHAQMLCARELHADMVREYLAVVEGTPEPACGVIDAPIGKADGATIRREVRCDGKPAKTHYRVLESGRRALVRLRLETGRTHQIRVHLASIGHPVTGDFLYGSEIAELPGRFALHSAHLAFVHPMRGIPLEFDSPLPAALAALYRPSPEAQTAEPEDPVR